MKLPQYLKEKGISTTVYYPVPLHKMKVFERRCKKFNNLTEAERAVKEVSSIPIEPLMREDKIRYIAGKIKEFF